MAPHSSTLAWKIPWTEEHGGLQSMGSQRIGHDWVTSLSLSPALQRPGRHKTWCLSIDSQWNILEQNWEHMWPRHPNNITGISNLFVNSFSNSQFLEHSQMTEQYQSLRDLVDYAASPTKKIKGIGANLWTSASFLDYYITGLRWSPRRTNWCKNTNTDNTRTVKCKGYYLFFWQSNLPKPGFCLFINEVTSDVAWL